MEVLRVDSKAAGLPLLVRAADGRTFWTFIDAPHSLPRVFDWRRDSVEAPAALAAQMEAHGHLVLDGVLPPPVVEQVGSYIRRLHADNELQPGEQYAKSTALGQRGDVIKMVASDDKSCPALQEYVSLCDRVYAAISRHIPEISSHSSLSRSQPMLALYPGKSAAYPRHVDNPRTSRDNGRIITAILYLNPSWAAGDGGELRLAPVAPAGREPMVIDIPPVMNRLVLFWSDERMPHEVRPAHAMRSACTIWFIDESRFTKFHGSNDGSSSTSKAAAAAKAAAADAATNTVAPNTSSAARLLSALENRGIGVRAKALGMSGHQNLGRSLPFRLAQIQILVNKPGATIGWLPEDAQHAKEGVSIVHAARTLLDELNDAAVATKSNLTKLLQSVKKSLKDAPRLLLVQHQGKDKGMTTTIDLQDAAQQPKTSAGFALLYCLSLSSAQPPSRAAAGANSGVRIELSFEDARGDEKIVPLMAGDTVTALVCSGKLARMRLVGAFTVLMVFC